MYKRQEYKDGDIVQRVVVKARRGSILDRSGEVLAKDEDTYTVIAILSKTRKDIGNRPAYVQDIDKTARLLAPKLGLEEAFLRKKLEDARDLNMYQTEFGEKGKYLSNSVKESIAAVSYTHLDVYKRQALCMSQVPLCEVLYRWKCCGWL